LVPRYILQNSRGVFFSEGAEAPQAAAAKAWGPEAGNKGKFPKCIVSKKCKNKMLKYA